MSNIFNRDKFNCGHIEFEPLNHCFPGNIRPSDIDGIVEIRGEFLILEGKGNGVPVDFNTGQMRTLIALSKLPQFTVVLLWCESGDPLTTSRVQILPYKALDRDFQFLANVCYRWACKATGVQPKADFVKR